MQTQQLRDFAGQSPVVGQGRFSLRIGNGVDGTYLEGGLLIGGFLSLARAEVLIVSGPRLAARQNLFSLSRVARLAARRPFSGARLRPVTSQSALRLRIAVELRLQKASLSETESGIPSLVRHRHARYRTLQTEAPGASPFSSPITVFSGYRINAS
jgi:hypothetical protein